LTNKDNSDFPATCTGKDVCAILGANSFPETKKNKFKTRLEILEKKRNFNLLQSFMVNDQKTVFIWII